MKEPHRSLIIGSAAAVVFVASIIWPAASVVLWMLFAGVIVVALYFDLRRPVNYDKMRISDGSIEYTWGNTTTLIELTNVERVEFVREAALFEDEGPYIESKWRIWMAGSHAPIEIMDEWPHRRLLTLAFRRYLPNFNVGASRQGFHTSGEGQWLCYSRSKRQGLAE